MTIAAEPCRVEDEAALEDEVEVGKEQEQGEEEEEEVIYHGHMMRISNLITSPAIYSR